MNKTDLISTFSAVVKKGDWKTLENMLRLMPKSDFRKLQAIMREDILPQLDCAEFWSAYLALVRFRHQAFLSCIFSAGNMIRNGSFSFTCSQAREAGDYFVTHIPDARPKVLLMLVPMMSVESDIDSAFDLFSLTDTNSRAAVLLRSDTTLSLYMLLKTLISGGSDNQLAEKCCRYLLDKGGDKAFNMVAIIKETLGLDNVKSVHSLRVEPYELNGIEMSFERFSDVLEGKRPKL